MLSSGGGSMGSEDSYGVLGVVRVLMGFWGGGGVPGGSKVSLGFPVGF